MLRSLFPLFAVTAMILLPTGESRGQGRAGGGASAGSGAGASSFGSSGLGGSSFGSSSFGSSGLGGSGMGGSGFGQSSLGQSSFGSGSTGSLTAGQSGQAAFVGRSAADLEAFFGGINQAAQSAQRQQRSRGGQSSGSNGAAGRRPEVRVTLSAAPELRQAVARIQPTGVAAATNVVRLMGRKGVSGVSADARDGVVTLEGVVTTASERLLAEKLAAIEPGVRRVENRLLVQREVEEIPPATR